jgi:voltage-gated potassium channel
LHQILCKNNKIKIKPGLHAFLTFEAKLKQMKRILASINTTWNSLLLVSVIFVSFIMPILPVSGHHNVLRFAYSILYIAALFSLQNRSKFLVGFTFTTFIVHWVSGILDMEVLVSVSKSLNGIFFLVIVAMLIRQISMARNVTAGVILDSFAGYLLLGIVYSLIIAYILNHDPGAYNVQPVDPSQNDLTADVSVPMYYGFVTLATVGYGDVVPLKPYTRSLATWIAITGQFYIAIIVALLVGKFAVQRHSKDDPDSN